jgi:hypothetical protein
MKPPTRRAIAVVLLVGGSGGLGARARGPSLDDDARSYVRLAVALGERDPDSIDFYAGPDDLVADVRRTPPPLTAIRRDAVELAARVAHAPAANADDGRRAQQLNRDLMALASRVDVLTGARPAYDRESETFFGVAPGPIDEGRMTKLRAEIGDLVSGRGRLVDRYTAFAARFIVPPSRLPAVMAAAIDECRQRTIAHLTLPPAERVTLEFVNGRPWSAYSRYVGGARSVISVNRDFRFTVDQALQVACHEGYPGHHTRSTLVDSRLARAKGWAEFLVQPMFSTGSLVSEATAMYAPQLAFSPRERVRVERDRLCRLAGIAARDLDRYVRVERLVEQLQAIQGDVARRYLDGSLEFARAAAVLEERALVPHAEVTLKYFNEYRSYVTTYTAGAAAVARLMTSCVGASAAKDVRWRCFERLLTRFDLQTDR